jgi:hypothetical protein
MPEAFSHPRIAAANIGSLGSAIDGYRSRRATYLEKMRQEELQAEQQRQAQEARRQQDEAIEREAVGLRQRNATVKRWTSASKSGSGDVFLFRGLAVGDRLSVVYKLLNQIEAQQSLAVVDNPNKSKTLVIGPAPLGSDVNSRLIMRSSLYGFDGQEKLQAWYADFNSRRDFVAVLAMLEESYSRADEASKLRLIPTRGNGAAIESRVLKWRTPDGILELRENALDNIELGSISFEWDRFERAARGASPF